MSKMARFASTLHRLTLRLYPKGFRHEFADEMNAVFAASAGDAAADGEWSLFVLCSREVKDLPINLLRAHWRERRRRRPTMQNSRWSSQMVRAAMWGALAFGLSTGLTWLVSTIARDMVAQGSLRPESLDFARAAQRSLVSGTFLYALAGGLGGALFGALVRRSRERMLLYSVICASAFAIGFNAANAVLLIVATDPATRSSTGALALGVMAQPVLIGALVGLLLGRVFGWGVAAQSMLAGAFGFGLGRLAGFVLWLPAWAIAQAIASYQAVDTRLWIVDAAARLPSPTDSVMTGIIGGAILGLSLAWRQPPTPSPAR